MQHVQTRGACTVQQGMAKCQCRLYLPRLEDIGCWSELVEFIWECERWWRLDDHIDRACRWG